MSLSSLSIRARAVDVLSTADPADKARAALQVYDDLLSDDLLSGDQASGEGGATPLAEHELAIPPRPARPERPVLTPPGQVPRRRLSSARGRVALLHAIAHIEFNAIDLAFDIIARFLDAPELDGVTCQFAKDWARVGADEARHFTMIAGRLADYGAAYGDLPAHDGLWGAAVATARDLAARLAIAPLVLEARGLDVTPGMIEKLQAVDDTPSADILQVIYTEEITHVEAGSRWFHHVANFRREDPQNMFDRLVRSHFAGAVKPPFNIDARAEAGLPYDWYAHLTQVEAFSTQNG